MIHLNLGLVLSSVPAKAPVMLAAVAERTARCGRRSRPARRAVLEVEMDHEAEFETEENVLANDKCHRSPGDVIVTAQPTHELSALYPVSAPARRWSDPGPFNVHVPCRRRGWTTLLAAGHRPALRPTKIDLADPDIELTSVFSVGGGR